MSKSPFAKAAASLDLNGYSVIPIHPKDKCPGEWATLPWGGEAWTRMKNWDTYYKRKSTQDEIAVWSSWPDGNIGITLGELSGIVALDLDNDIDSLHRAIEDIVPDSPVKKKGAKGYTAFYKFNTSIATKKTYSRKGVRVAEILTNGQQTVVPPSRHPSGVDYTWTTERTLENTKADELPEITPEMLEQIEALFPKDVVQHTPYRAPTAHEQTTLSEIEKALHYIDCDDYDIWVQTGMSLKQEYGDTGFALWDAWSGRSSKYNGHEMQKKWQSFKRSDRTLASIIFEAKQSGYVREPRAEVDPIEILPGGNLKPIIHREMEKHYEEIPEKLLNAPNLVGDTMRFILDTALYPQPVLALAAAISAVGVVMGHRVTTERFDLRSNIFTLGIASSGAGKEHARKCIRKLFAGAQINNVLCGTPVSGTAVINSVHRAQGRAYMMIDEMGRFLQAVNSNKAAAHQINITTCMMDMYNSASDVYVGQEYANNETKGGRSDIAQPCLGIYGTTVPGRFYAALSSEEAIDGFLARWLIFETTRFDVEPREDVASMIPPDSLVEKYRAWQDHSTYNKEGGGNIEQTTVVPKVVTFTHAARDMMFDFIKSCRKNAHTEIKNRSGYDAIWNRAGEHAIKLALVGHQMGEPIDTDVVDWAIALAENRTRFLIQAVSKHVSNNQQEAITKRLYRLVEEAGKDGITKATIVTKTQFLKRMERNEILSTLQETGAITEEEIAGTRRPIKVYKATGLNPDAA
jgi:hypothetical protein